MKQFLFATTAIVAFTGAAAADVNISGLAEMGIVGGDEDNTAGDGDVEFFTDIDVTFTLAGATDTGLTYGASIDLDESDDAEAFDARDQGGENIFISGGFGTLTMGDTDGAIDWALAEVGFDATSINDDHEHGGWNGNAALDGVFDGQILRYDYTIGDFGVAISGEVDDNSNDGSDPILGIGLRGSFDFAGNAIGFGIGYQTGSEGSGVQDVVESAGGFTTTTTSDFADEDREAFGASLNGTFGVFEVGVTYTNFDNNNQAAVTTTVVDDANPAAPPTTNTVISGTDDSGEHYGIGVGYNAGPLSLHANYGEYDFDDGSDRSGFGVTAGYELGEDVEVQLGYGHTDGRGAGAADSDFFNDGDSFSFGVAMSF